MKGGSAESFLWKGTVRVQCEKVTTRFHLSLRMRKQTIWVSDQVRHKPAYTVIEGEARPTKIIFYRS